MVRPDWKLEEATYGCSEPWHNAALLTQSVIHRICVEQIHWPAGGMLCRPLSACTDVALQRLMGRRVCGRLIWLKVNGVTLAIADGCLTPWHKGHRIPACMLVRNTHNINETPRRIDYDITTYITLWLFVIYSGHMSDAYSFVTFFFWKGDLVTFSPPKM